MGLPTDVNLELGGPARLSTLLKYMMSAIVTVRFMSKSIVCSERLRRPILSVYTHGDPRQAFSSNHVSSNLLHCCIPPLYSDRGGYCHALVHRCSLREPIPMSTFSSGLPPGAPVRRSVHQPASLLSRYRGFKSVPRCDPALYAFANGVGVETSYPAEDRSIWHLLAWRDVSDLFRASYSPD